MTIRACTLSKIFGAACPRTSPELFLFLNQLQISFAEKKIRLKTLWKLCSPPSLKFLATPLSAVYQHFSNKESKFRSKVAVKDSQDCDAIL